MLSVPQSRIVLDEAMRVDGQSRAKAAVKRFFDSIHFGRALLVAMRIERSAKGFTDDERASV